MLFNVERDDGAQITAYIVPDSGGATPSIIIRANGRDIACLEANRTLANLVEVGRHATGCCGFVIDEALVPGLAAYIDLELLEASSGIMIYRRALPTAANTRVFRFESHLLPLWRLDDALRPRFQFWHKGIDRFGRETATQVFCLNNDASAYVSGRLLFKNFEFYLSKGVRTFGTIRDPFHELAERLILLKNIGERADQILGERDTMTFRPVIDALADETEFDERFCKRFFRRASAEVTSILSNPLVRQLTTALPDEVPSRNALAAALDALGSFELLGLRSGADDFSRALAEMLDVVPASLPALAEYPRVVQLGEHLRHAHEVEAMLETDLEVFHLVSNAVQTAAAA